MLSFLSPYLSVIKIAFIAILLAIMSTLYFQKRSAQNDLAIKTKELIELKVKCTQTQNEKEEAIKELNIKQSSNAHESKTKIETITRFTKDPNETQCQAANRLMRSTPVSF